MRMQSPSLFVSPGRSWFGNAIRLRNKPVRSLALLALIALAATALAATSSSAQLLFGKASAMVGLGSTPAPAPSAIKAAPVNPTLTAPNAPPSDIMLVERRGHTATRLSNGSVLIAGGENSSGVLNECEIYDPTSTTFSVTGNLGAARADHSATLLADGRVLIVGGRGAAGALNTTEIFDPT
ncbi:MAG TPA: kelch repeat-containing protein, partial [Pyrinomonadaceae bacterium]|nr:kelch repeat-containing protein [Pyrinomonadaceae bacterium]